MSTEEKITSTPETAELPKSKSRFKLDKKHIQGFIAGILLCAIAFTGLYYGTDGLFFAGSLTGRVPVVTDADFKYDLVMRDTYFIVAFGNNDVENRDWKSEVTDLAYMVSILKRNCGIGNMFVVELDPDKSENTIREHFSNGMHYAVFYNGLKIYHSLEAEELWDWLLLTI